MANGQPNSVLSQLVAELTSGRIRRARKRNTRNSSNELPLRLRWSGRSACCRAIQRGLRGLLCTVAPLSPVDAGVGHAKLFRHGAQTHATFEHA